MKTFLSSIIVSFIFVFVVRNVSDAQIPGTIDSSFATDGTLFLTAGYGFSVGKDVVALPDDRVLMTGIMQSAGGTWDIAVMRFMSDGSIDSTFGDNGQTLFDVSGDLDFVYRMALQEDGKIVVAGGGLVTPADIQIYVARLNPDGGLDATFGDNGIAWLTTDGGEDLAYAIAVMHDGSIEIAGQDQLGGTTLTSPIVARFTSDGVADTSFGNNGSTTINVTGDYSALNDLLPLNDGSVITVGYSATSHYDILVMKFTSAGLLDSTFADNGIAKFNLNTGNDAAYSIIKHPTDGRILIGGRIGNGTNKTDFLIMAIDDSGKIDSTFGINGLSVFSGGAQDALIDLSVQSNGKIVGCGTSGGTGLGSNDWAVCRLLEDGMLDYDFGVDSGLTISEVTDFFSEADGMAIQSNGRIVTVGNAGFQTGNQFGIVAYLGDEVIATGTTTPDEELTNSNVVIYPNPSNGQFIVIIDVEELSISEATLEIVNVLGQIVFAQKAPIVGGRLQQSIKLPDNLSSGQYLVRAQVNSKEYSTQLLFQK